MSQTVLRLASPPSDDTTSGQGASHVGSVLLGTHSTMFKRSVATQQHLRWCRFIVERGTVRISVEQYLVYPVCNLVLRLTLIFRCLQFDLVLVCPFFNHYLAFVTASDSLSRSSKSTVLYVRLRYRILMIDAA